MKKLLISTVIILLLILAGFTIIKGIKIGNFQILGIMEIKQKDEELDETIKQATKLASTDYSKKLDDLSKTIKEFEKTKNNYEEKVSISTESELQVANQYGVYEIGMLWIQLGNHAKSEGVTLDISARNLTEVESNASTQSEKKYSCNLNFTAIGTYAGIAGFIEDIEDDSKLGFRIENFKISPSSESGSNTLQATFTCSDVIVRGVSVNSSTENQNSSRNSNDTTSNTTNNNTTSNTTEENTTNTVNNTTK